MIFYLAKGVTPVSKFRMNTDDLASFKPKESIESAKAFAKMFIEKVEGE